MANQIMTAGTELASLVPEVWSARFQELNRALLPFIDSVSRDWEGEIQDLGDIVNINDIPDFDEALTLGEGAAGDAQAVTASATQLTINQRPYKDFIVSKRSQMQSIAFMDALRERAVYSINKKIQKIVIDAISPSASAPDHQIAYDSGTTLALADILEAKELLMGSDVPQEGLCMVVSEAQFNDLFNISGVTSRDFVPAGSPLSSGDFAVPFLGFDIKFTSEADGVTYCFHPSFLTMALQQDLNIEVMSMGADGVRGTRVNVDALMGVAQLDNKRVVTIS